MRRLPLAPLAPDAPDPPEDRAASDLHGPVVFEAPECVECGKCCLFGDARYVMLFEEDTARMTESDRQLTHWVKGRCFMRVTDHHCAALVLDGGLFVCSIYERRPRLCREFPRGSAACRREIEGGVAASQP